MNPPDLPVRRARVGLVATLAILASACATGEDPSGPTRTAPIRPDVADIVRTGRVLGFRLEELRASRGRSQMARRVGEAVASIEGMVEQGQIDLARQALDFAVNRLGDLDELERLRRRLDLL